VRPDQVYPDSVAARIEELRPAGVRILSAKSAETALAVNLNLVFAGSSQPQATSDAIVAKAKQTLVAEISKRGVGQKVRVQPLVAALLADNRIADAAITLQAKGGAAGQPGADFTPDPGATVSLAPADISLGPITFEQGPPAAQKVPVEVRAMFKLSLLAGTTAPAAQTALTQKLTQYFGSLPVDTQVDLPAVLAAVRDDTKYAIDPLNSSITLSSAQQFFQIVQGGQSFRVLAGQTFSVTPVEVTP
jgi:hypothetical protein